MKCPKCQHRELALVARRGFRTMGKSCLEMHVFQACLSRGQSNNTRKDGHQNGKQRWELF